MEQITFDLAEGERLLPHSYFFCSECEHQRLMVPEDSVRIERAGYCVFFDFEGPGDIQCPVHGEWPEPEARRESRPPETTLSNSFNPNRVRGEMLFPGLIVLSSLGVFGLGVASFITGVSVISLQVFLLAVATLCLVLEAVSFYTYEP